MFWKVTFKNSGQFRHQVLVVADTGYEAAVRAERLVPFMQGWESAVEHYDPTEVPNHARYIVTEARNDFRSQCDGNDDISPEVFKAGIDEFNTIWSALIAVIG